MDSKAFTSKLARNLGEDPHRVVSMVDAFATILRRSATNLTAVAIPSFGTFSPVKLDEEIVTDHSTGKRMMLPPQIVVEFQPAAMLRKKINSHE